MQQEELDALKKACLYAFQPNRLGYCGPEQSWQFFQEFISQPTEENSSKAKALLQDFKAFMPYAQLIANANNFKPLIPETVEAYWLGNDLLENISPRETQKTILSLQHHGLPRSIAEKKALQLPEGMLPHHSMHVLYINFLTQKLEPIIPNLSSCLIQWARVEEQTAKGIKVKGIELLHESNELKLKEKEKTVQNPFNIELQPKDIISVHWNTAVETISKQQAKNLKKYTERTLASLKLAHQ